MRRSLIVKIISIVLTLVTVSSLFLALPSSAPIKAAGYNNATIQSYEAAIEKLKQQMKDTQKKLNSISKEQKAADEEAALIDEQIELTSQKIEQTNLLISELNSQIDDKLLEITEKEADIAEQYQRFKNRVRVAYEEGDVSYLEMIFGSQDLTDFLLRFEYINSMIEYDNRLMKDYQSQKAEYEFQKQQLEAAKELQDKYSLELEEEKNSLDESRAKVDKIRSDLRKQYAEWYTEYKKQKDEEEKKSAELEDYIQKLMSQDNVYIGGEFIWPLPTKYSRISSKFGGRWLFGYWDNHQAIDIPCALDTNVYASNGGKVIVAEFHKSYGYYVVIDHGGGKSTLYAHNNSLVVKAGDYVSQGQIIAKAGTTGTSTGVHCHFEYRVNGVRYDPLLIVSQP
ncbi:MAG: peptidoglycan DD-metalloendopeptidase family protein [Clostridia bacterium]|nr:peptidoglycan DD-metalloendopeptidase family protein [Clostridia bacterium]